MQPANTLNLVPLPSESYESGEYGESASESGEYGESASDSGEFDQIW